MGGQKYQVVEQEQTMAQFLWNSSTGEFLGRNGTSWCMYLIILCFYFNWYIIVQLQD